MAKGAKKKIKWVSLSLGNANTKTSVMTGSDKDHGPHEHQQHHEGGHRNKIHSDSSLPIKNSKQMVIGTVLTEAHNEQAHDTDHAGCQNDNGKGRVGSLSECGQEQRTNGSGAYYKRRLAQNHTYANGSAGVSNKRNHYNRTSSNTGYYASGRRSYYDNHTRRQQDLANRNRTISDGGRMLEGKENTVNDDEYTRITTPRQDVLFKKGYLSRPKPAATTTTCTSNINTATNSIAGTTSEGSDGGNGGSNSISTTESITSEYGGSYAADGTPLFDYSFPYLPYGYFIENGVLVMNGFAVDNNGFSYFNGGQTYIYPPNFNDCQHPSAMATIPADQQTNDETNANEMSNIDAHPSNLSTSGIDSRSLTDMGNAIVSSESFNDTVGAIGDGHLYTNSRISSMEQSTAGIVLNQETNVDNNSFISQDGQLLAEAQMVPNAESNLNDGVVSSCPQNGQDFMENGFYQYNDYDLTHFSNPLCYQNWLMEQYQWYDDAGLYCGREYGTSSEDVIGHQTSYKKRKKRCRTFEESSGETKSSFDSIDILNSAGLNKNAVVNSLTGFVADSSVAVESASHQVHQLNADVEAFQPSLDTCSKLSNDTVTATTPGLFTSANGISELTTSEIQQKLRKPNVLNAPKHSKLCSKSTLAPTSTIANESNVASNLSASQATARSTVHKTNRKKDLIESTLAFAAQNIDLTRPITSTADARSHDSQIFWTTIERNGRKKRISQQQSEQETSSINEKQNAQCNEKPENSVGETPQSVVSVDSKKEESMVESLHVADMSVLSLDTNAKKETQCKSKKKIHKHKRQQLRKSMGNFHKQPLEGFQLIEPEFPSSTTGHRRGRNCDNVVKTARIDGNKPETPITDLREKEEANYEKSSSDVEQDGLTDDKQCTFVDEEKISKNLICDNMSAIAPIRVPESQTNKDFEQEEVVAESSVPSEILSPSVGEYINDNEIETETEEPPHSRESLYEGAPIQNEVQETAIVNREIKLVEDDLTKPIDTETNSQAAFPVQEQLSVAALNFSEFSRVEPPMKDMPLCNKPGESELKMTEMSQTTDINMPVEEHVLTSAAKQLVIKTVSSNSQLDDEEEVEEQTESAEDGNGSDGDNARVKRSSVSGMGYTESIDSGLQSPAPCGGVASPEVSSMTSSLDSQPMIDSQESETRSSPLSEVVGKWLIRKLEVHDPEEVFVLPSNPLLIQRLQQFHQLQQRVFRDRIRGVITFDSEVEDEEYDLDDEDTDSDYMSDGQGRLEHNLFRVATTDTASTQHGSLPSSTDTGVCQTNDAQGRARSIDNQNDLDQNEHDHHLSTAKRSHTVISDNLRNNSEGSMLDATVTSPIKSKRCLIM